MISYFIMYLVSIILSIVIFLFSTQIQIFGCMGLGTIILIALICILNIVSIILMIKNRKIAKINLKDKIVVILYILFVCFLLVSYYFYNDLIFLKSISIFYLISLLFIPNIILSIYNIIIFKGKKIK